MLVTKYFERLGLNPLELEGFSRLERLQAICAAHLERIPFENLSQHGVGEPVSLDVEKLANKILDRNRGGFCFELNGLLAELLLELEYKLVRVAAHVYNGDGYMEDASHLFLMVTLPADDPGKKSETMYLVDVGFGEPAIHPLRYEFNTAQSTPEGMVSRFVKTGYDVALEWRDVKTDMFVPRFKFKATDATMEGPGPHLVDFHDNLMTVYHPQSPFEQKVILCRVNVSLKVTVAGNRIKITGLPRFDKNLAPVMVQELGDVHNVRAVLDSDFGIPLHETEGLLLTKSLKSPHEVWMQQ